MAGEEFESVVIKKIHLILSNRCLPDGYINRKKFFQIVSERIGKIDSVDREALVEEFIARGIIKECNKCYFIIDRVTVEQQEEK